MADYDVRTHPGALRVGDMVTDPAVVVGVVLRGAFRRRYRRLWITSGLLLLDGEATVLESLLLFHASILEPDLDLRLVESERRSDLDPPCSRQVLVEVKLLLELSQLFVGEIRATHVRLTRK